MAQWEAFLKKHSYIGHSKTHLSGFALSTVPPTLSPSASASSEAGRPAPPPRPPAPTSEGHGHSGELEGVPCMGSREISSPPSCRSMGEELGAPQGPQLLGSQVIWLLLPSRGLE